MPGDAAMLRLIGACALVVTLGGCERFVSDAATRLAYQIRDQAGALRQSGEPARTFAHHPLSWPEGVDGDYRIELV